MSAHCFILQTLKIIFTVLLLLSLPFGTLATDMEGLLPPVSCGGGWQIEGKPVFYDRETLSDRINGEAELYLPYGFDRMAAARYASLKNPDAGMDVEIYRMGTLLDAFGMFANYRQKDGRVLSVGADSNLSGSQLYFYQDRHFVHIQVTGSGVVDPAALPDCVRVVASRLPGKKDRPIELSVLDRPEFIMATVRYLPQSLLGYDFLNKGFMVDAVLNGANLQIILIPGTKDNSVSTGFDGFRSLLVQGKIEAAGKSSVLLEGVDPLYGPVVILRKGNCLAGALKFNGKKGILPLLESVCR
jgi:hypothetical protein